MGKKKEFETWLEGEIWSPEGLTGKTFKSGKGSITFDPPKKTKPKPKPKPKKKPKKKPKRNKPSTNKVLKGMGLKPEDHWRKMFKKNFGG